MSEDADVTFFKMYDENLNNKTFWEAKDSLERQSDSPESWNDILERQERKKYEQCNKRKMPLGVCSGVGEYITYHLSYLLKWK